MQRASCCVRSAPKGLTQRVFVAANRKGARERVDFTGIVDVDAGNFRTIGDFHKRHVKSLASRRGRLARWERRILDNPLQEDINSEASRPGRGILAEVSL